MSSTRQGGSWEASHPAAEGSWNALPITDTRGLSSLEGALGKLISDCSAEQNEVMGGLSAVQGTRLPQEYANKNLFRLPHRKCSLQSVSSQGHPDQNSLSHNEASFLVTSTQRWEDVKNHELPVIHLLSNYGLQSLKSPENNVSLILFKETQRDWLSLCSPDWLRTHHIPALPIKC